MTSPGQIKRNRVPVEEDQNSTRRNNPFADNVEPLTETVKSLVDRFERLEALVQKIFATEGKIFFVLMVLHLMICIKEQRIEQLNSPRLFATFGIK